MKIFAFIQARMSSNRLPGKVLASLEGKPVLLYLIESLRKVTQLEGIAVLTSLDRSDLPVAEFCETNGIAFFRGDLLNVAERFLGAIRHFSPDAFVRISGDSPLIDPRLVDEAVSRFREGHHDLVTNVMTRSFPKGQSVEVVRSSIFCDTLSRFAEQDLEHVTPYFYRHRDQFRILNLTAPGGDHSTERLCIDDPKDLVRCENILHHFHRHPADIPWKEMSDFLNHNGAETGK